MADQRSTLATDSRAAAFEIIAKVEANTGLAIKSLFEQDLAPDEIRRQMHSLILDWVEQKQAGESANSDWPLAGQRIDPREAIFGSSGAHITPDVAIVEYNYNIIKKYRGKDIKDHVERTCNGLALLREDMTPGEAAATIIGSALAAFATKMIVETVKALRAGSVLRAAVTTGVKAMGKMSVVVGVALVIITELLLYLVFKNQKNFLGIVYNNTPLNLVVYDWRGGNNSDLYFETGEMNTFPEAPMTEFLDSPLVQVIAKYDQGDVKENIISGGIFFAEKKPGLFGTEGAMVFTNYTQGHTETVPRFAALFASPYNLDNGVNVSIQTSGKPTSAKTFYQQLYRDRGQYKTTTIGGYTFSAACAAPTKGDAAGIYTLDKK
jgi:hypothetical protein